MKALGKATTDWSPQFAYSLGLLVTDGSLSIDGRHISFTSKDYEQVETFRRCLGISAKICTKRSGPDNKRDYFLVQFSDRLLYLFLVSIGFTPNKTKTIGAIAIPDKYFADFLRGHLDGDGSTYSYFDPRWPTSFLFYTTFISASRQHIEWLGRTIDRLYSLSASVVSAGGSVYRVRYGKRASLTLLPLVYYSQQVPCLRRKRLKIARAFGIITTDALSEGLRVS